MDMKKGVFILTGPSGCGKGEVASFLMKEYSIDSSHHLSMGQILRDTIEAARKDPKLAKMLSLEHGISLEGDIFSSQDAHEISLEFYHEQLESLNKYFGREMERNTSQLDWLEFCTFNGFLVPNRWTQEFIYAHFKRQKNSSCQLFIVDGYPRTVQAATHLLDICGSLDLPILKVFHLFITKMEMKKRAKGRRRKDDLESALDARYQFYVESVQPSIDYMKNRLGYEKVVLVDAHQPVFDQEKFCLEASIKNMQNQVHQFLKRGG